MLKKRVVFLSLFLAFYANNSYAIDARSTALGGTTQGLSNGAFAPLRNPASMTDLGWGHFILPLSPNINIGNSVNINSVISSANSLDKLLTTIKDNLAGYRFETNINLPIIGYSGIPTQNFKIFDKQIAIGFNILLNSNNYFLTGSGNSIANILGAGLNVYDFTNNNIPKMNDLFSGVKNLSNFDFNKFNNLDFGNPSQIQALSQEVKELQNNQIKTILDIGPALLTNLENIEKQILNLLDVLSKSEKIQNAGQVVADGHLTIMASGASKVYSNDIFDVSIGINMKGFMFPYNQRANNLIPVSSLPSVTRDLVNSMFNNQNLLPIASKINLELGDFKSTTEVKDFINNKINPLIQDSKKVVDDLNNLNKTISNILELSNTNPIAIINEIPDARKNVTSLQSSMQSMSNKVNSSDVNAFSREFLGVLAKDFQNIKINIEQYTDVSPFGLGFDLGVQSKIYKHTTVGLFLQNPLVIWPAKLRNITVGFVNPNNNNLLTVENVSDLKSANYNLSEPFAIRLGGSHNLEYLHPILSNTLVLADIEQVFNGRNFALHLGLEKGFKFNNSFGLALRLGGQIGGIANMMTAGLGIQGGPFNLDLAIASGNLFNPINSNGASVGLSTSLNF